MTYIEVMILILFSIVAILALIFWLYVAIVGILIVTEKFVLPLLSKNKPTQIVIIKQGQKPRKYSTNKTAPKMYLKNKEEQI